MKCRVARMWMRARIDAPLAAADERTLHVHLESCRRCAAEARDLEQLRGWLALLPLAEPSANFDWRLRLRLSKAEHEDRPPLFEPQMQHARPGLEFWGAAAAAALVVVATGLYLLRPPAEVPGRRGLAAPAVVDNRPVLPDVGSQLTPVRDAPIVGPQLPPPNAILLFPQQVGPPAPEDTLPTASPSAR